MNWMQVSDDVKGSSIRGAGERNTASGQARREEKQLIG
jgi:hypothetical protein